MNSEGKIFLLSAVIGLMAEEIDCGDFAGF